MSIEDSMPRSTALREAVEHSKQDERPVTELLTVAEACAYLRISKTSLYDLIRKKKMKSVKIGHRRLIRMQSILEFVKRLEAETGV